MKLMSEKTDDLFVMTPVGTLAYVRINGKPKEGSTDDGFYICLELTKEEGEELRQKALNHWMNSKSRETLLNKSKGKNTFDNPIIKIDFVDDIAKVHCKQHRKGKHKDTGEEFDFVIKIFDGKGNELPKETRVWGGSTGRVKLNLRAWEYGFRYGVRLQIKDVQVAKLITPEPNENYVPQGFDAIPGADDLTGVVGAANEGMAPLGSDEDIPF